MQLLFPNGGRITAQSSTNDASATTISINGLPALGDGQSMAFSASIVAKDSNSEQIFERTFQGYIIRKGSSYTVRGGEGQTSYFKPNLAGTALNAELSSSGNGNLEATVTGLPFLTLDWQLSVYYQRPQASNQLDLNAFFDLVIDPRDIEASDGDDIPAFSSSDANAASFANAETAKATYHTNQFNGHPALRFAGSESLETTDASIIALPNAARAALVALVLNVDNANPGSFPAVTGFSRDSDSSNRLSFNLDTQTSDERPYIQYYSDADTTIRSISAGLAELVPPTDAFVYVSLVDFYAQSYHNRANPTGTGEVLIHQWLNLEANGSSTVNTFNDETLGSYDASAFRVGSTLSGGSYTGDIGWCGWKFIKSPNEASDLLRTGLIPKAICSQLHETFIG